MIRESHDSWFAMIRRITNPNQIFWVTESESRIRIINSECWFRITNPNLKFWGTKFESRIRIIYYHKTTKNRIRITNRIIDFEIHNPNSNHMANHHFPLIRALSARCVLDFKLNPRDKIEFLLNQNCFFIVCASWKLIHFLFWSGKDHEQ